MRFYKETEFKKADLNGEVVEIPKDWDVVKLEKICKDMYYGITAKAVENPTNFRMLRTTDIRDYKVDWDSLPYCEITEAKKNIEKYKIKAGDIIVARSGTVGVSVLVKKDFEDIIFGSYLIKVALNTMKAYPKFVHYFMQSNLYWNQINIASAGSTLHNIKLPILKNLKIPLPPLEEQKRIAQVLMKIDEAIEKTEKIIEKTERLKRGFMQKLLNGEIRIKAENGRISFYKETQFENTEIGKIPKDWEVVRLGDVVEVYDSKRIPLSEQERANRKGPYPYCGATGIIDYIDDYIFEGEYVLLAEDGGNFGPFEQSAYIMTGKFWVNNHAHVLKAKDDISNNWYLMYILNYMDLSPYIVGSTRAKLNQTDMRRIKIPLPPLEEQKKIAEILSNVDKKLELERKEKEKLERIKKGLMDILLTGKVRVRV